jgi:hypothetical protein
VKIDDQFPDHPKVVALSDAAIALWLRGICYCSRYLTDGAIPERVLAFMLEVERELYKLGVPVKLIVVDTLSRAIFGGNENAPDDMGALVTNGTKIQQSIAAHVLWIHHSGKDEARGARGHSLLRAATDTEIEISANGDQRCARVTKQRELENEGVFPFRLRVVELGINRRGKPVTSCVVEPGGDMPATKSDSLTGHTLTAMTALHNTMAADGRRNKPGVPDGVAAVHSEAWRREFYSKCGSEGTQDGKSKAFRRAVLTLQTRQMVAFHDDWVWVTRGETGE